MTVVTNLKQALDAIDAEVATLTEGAVALGTEVFTSVEEYEPEAFWKVRKAFIELAKARQIRQTLTPAPPVTDGAKPPEDAKPPRKRRRKTS